MAIFFTADTHFGHAGILNDKLTREGRFDSVEDMDNCIIDGINSTVARQDELWHLGDFGWTPKRYGHYRQRLNVRKLHVLRGNHDRASLGKYVSTFEMLILRSFKKMPFVLCHYPIYSWPAKVYGSVHLYGHCHAMAETRLSEITPIRRSLDAGIDNAYRLLGTHRPFSLDEILDLLNVKGKINDTMYRMWSDSGKVPRRFRSPTSLDCEPS